MWIAPLIWLVKIGAVSLLVLGVYLQIASHHYSRGWAARNLEYEEAVRAANDRIGGLNRRLEDERNRGDRAREAAVKAALESLRGYCEENPGSDQCPVRPIATAANSPTLDCGLPAVTIDKLNRIR